MIRANKVSKLVHDDVFDALARLIDQIKVEIQCALFEIAAAPARFHGVNADSVGGHDEAALLVRHGKRGKARDDQAPVTFANDSEQLLFLPRLIIGRAWRHDTFFSLIACNGMGDAIGVTAKKRVDLPMWSHARNGQSNAPIGANAQI